MALAKLPPSAPRTPAPNLPSEPVQMVGQPAIHTDRRWCMVHRGSDWPKHLSKSPLAGRANGNA